MTMRRAAVATLLALASSAAAAGWGEVGGSDSYTVYADRDTLRVAGDTVKMWSLVDYKAHQSMAGLPYLSMRWHVEYDCKAAQSRRLYLTAHSGKMAGGRIIHTEIDPGDWVPVAPGTIADDLWQFACAKR